MGLKHELPTLTDERLLVSEGIRDTKLLPEQIDEGPELGHRHPVGASVFPQETVDAAAAAGIGAIIQPGGSVRDAEVIAAADQHGLAMVFTGIRHFRH